MQLLCQVPVGVVLTHTVNWGSNVTHTIFFNGNVSAQAGSVMTIIVLVCSTLV